MKRAFISLLSAFVIMLVGCTEDPVLTLRSGNNTIDIPSNGGSASISISCNNTWSASSSASWITVSPSSGAAGDCNITITTAANSETVERQGVVTVQSEGLTLNISVKQAEANAIILSQKDVNISDEGGTIVVNVKANVNYTVDISNGTGWLENIGSKAMTSKDYTFSVKKNDNYDDRTAVITFKDATSGISESVTVHQAQKGAIILSKNSVQVPDEGGSIEVELKSSLEYSINILSGSEWVKRTDTKALNTYKHSFSVAANDTYDSREARVAFNSKTTNVSDTLTIRQAHRRGLIVTERQKHLDAAGGTFDVELQSNVDYNIIMPAGVSWLKRLDTKGLETYNHTFSVEENKTYDDRSTSVIFKSKDGALTDTLFVTQRQLNALILSDKSYSLDDEAHDITVKIRSNITYSVEVEAGIDWVSEVRTKALSEYTHVFRVAANPDHAIRKAAVYFKSDTPNLIDSLVIEQGLSGVASLSTNETANCYIVEKEGVYTFNATVIGNGNKGIVQGYHFHVTDASIDPKNVKLLWQDHEIVSNLMLQNGRVFFNASSQKGNAVIAVTDSEGKILWSWHIWATDRPEEIRLTEATHAYLDRNLGATTVTLGLETSNGMYYQWGRKDPFNPDQRKMESVSSPLSINMLVENPTTMFFPNESVWVNNDEALWGDPDGEASSATFKTIYDPCPQGYTIPSDAAWYEYYDASMWDGHRYYSRMDRSITVTCEVSGITASKNGKLISYPVAGALTKEENLPSSYYLRNNTGRAFGVIYGGPGELCSYSANYGVTKSMGNPIRCVKEETYMAFPPTVETLDASDIKVKDLVVRGKVTNNGNTPIKAAGFYWGLSQNDLNNRIEATFSPDGFSHHLDNLPVHSTVYVRAFAENESGRGFGELKMIRLNSATEYTRIVLDSLSRFMFCQYTDYGQGFNGEGAIRLFYGDYPGNTLSVNLPNWNNLMTSNTLSDPSSKYTSYPLYYYYRIINKVNSTLDNYVTLADASDPNIDHYKAELLGYRAYAYTMLAQLYCKSWDASGNGSSSGLPLRIYAADDVTTASTLAETYQQIYADLETAINLMKQSSIIRDHIGEMDLRVLYAIYAKAALNRKDFSKAIDYAKLARTGFPLMTNGEYNSGFNQSNQEWIWGVNPYYATEQYTLYYYGYYSYIGYNSNSSQIRNYPKCISKELFNQIPATDIRKGLFLNSDGYSYNASTGEAQSNLKSYAINYARSDGRKGLTSNAKVYAYMNFKFAATFMPGGGQMNFIRAAEMVLIEAEANYFIGNEGETRNLLNYLNKDSRRDPSYNCTATGAALLDELKTYRRIELWGEGFDWFDTKRWGDPVSRKAFVNGGNFIEELAGTWSASEKNDFVWVMPNDYTAVIRTGSGI